MAKELECGRVLSTHARKQQVNYSLFSSLLLSGAVIFLGCKGASFTDRSDLVFTELYTQHVSRFTLLNKRLIEIVLIN